MVDALCRQSRDILVYTRGNGVPAWSRRIFLCMDSCRGYFFFILSHRNDLESETRSTDATKSDTAVPTPLYVEAIWDNDNVREGRRCGFQ